MNVPVSAIAILALALVVAAAIALDAPLLALPLAFVVLVVWAGERVASARGRA
jgi:hypothetical protein